MASLWQTTITATTNGKNLSRKVSSKIGLMLHLVIVERSPCKAIMRRKKYGSAILKLKSYSHHIDVSTYACNSLVPSKSYSRIRSTGRHRPTVIGYFKQLISIDVHEGIIRPSDGIRLLQIFHQNGR